MHRALSATVVAFAGALSACASGPTPVPTAAPPAPTTSSTTAPIVAPVAPLPAGRYMQVRHPVYGTVLIQLSFPDGEGCASVTSSLMAADAKSGPARAATTCHVDSASAQLRAAATLRDRTALSVYPLEATTTALCQAFAADMVASSRGAMQIVADCKDK